MGAVITKSLTAGTTAIRFECSIAPSARSEKSAFASSRPVEALKSVGTDSWQTKYSFIPVKPLAVCAKVLPPTFSTWRTRTKSLGARRTRPLLQRALAQHGQVQLLVTTLEIPEGALRRLSLAGRDSRGGDVGWRKWRPPPSLGLVSTSTSVSHRMGKQASWAMLLSYARYFLLTRRR